MIDESKVVDVAVIGGGPAGATAATLVADAGYQVRLFEREQFPRFHIGESLMPETYHTFRRLGVLDQLKSSPYQKKLSVQFVNEEGKESQPFYFDDHNPHESSRTWQVVRSDFDRMLLENASRHGVDVRQGTRVLEVLFEGEQAVGVKVQDADGTKEEISARVVIDASGQSSLIAHRLKLREPDPILKKGSIWTYYEGAQRDSGRNEGATLVLSTQGKKGWFWYIPLHDDKVSVGVVSSFEELFQSDRGPPEEIFYQEVERCPAVKKRLESGRRVTGFMTTKDFSYYAKQLAGDGWVLVGDAFGFLDPIYSSGVFLALKSGEMAADAVVAGLQAGDVGGDRLGQWGHEFLQGMERMKRLVYTFYEGVSFGRFVRENPHLSGHLVDLLVGKLFDPHVDEIVEPLEAMRRQVRAESLQNAGS